MKLKTSYYLILGWALCIMVLSLIPTSSLPDLSWSGMIGIDKLAHAIVYAILSFLMCYGFSEEGSKAMVIKAIVFSSFYGILMELLQFAIYTGRNFEFLDIIANIIGSFLGTIFFKFLGKYFNKWKD